MTFSFVEIRQVSPRYLLNFMKFKLLYDLWVLISYIYKIYIHALTINYKFQSSEKNVLNRETFNFIIFLSFSGSKNPFFLFQHFYSEEYNYYFFNQCILLIVYFCDKA